MLSVRWPTRQRLGPPAGPSSTGHRVDEATEFVFRGTVVKRVRLSPHFVYAVLAAKGGDRAVCDVVARAVSGTTSEHLDRLCEQLTAGSAVAVAGWRYVLTHAGHVADALDVRLFARGTGALCDIRGEQQPDDEVPTVPGEPPATIKSEKHEDRRVRRGNKSRHHEFAAAAVRLLQLRQRPGVGDDVESGVDAVEEERQGWLGPSVLDVAGGSGGVVSTICKFPTVLV